ncbi:MAG: helix-turn-helix transcriptional regulator [Clostridia bacterium]|nr:helix-turn-helix transcriptional regulator [Clostridia bacterium]
MMEYVTRKPIVVSLPGMEVYLTSYFFHGVSDRPSRLHTHPCYEIVCTKANDVVYFSIVPPLTEHVSKSTSIDGRICSFLFTFTEDDPDDICQILRSVNKVTEIQDTFNGLARLLAIQEALEKPHFGMKEHMKAEFRLFFVKLGQVFHSEAKISYENPQSLDDQRIALLEDFFNVEMRFPHCNKRQLADKIGVCERQLTRILQETYNSSFSAILLESRMNMAQAMLKDGAKSVGEIAESVGYTSLTSFRTAYKKFFGEYPKKNQDTTL